MNKEVTLVAITFDHTGGALRKFRSTKSSIPPRHCRIERHRRVDPTPQMLFSIMRLHRSDRAEHAKGCDIVEETYDKRPACKSIQICPGQYH